MRVVGGGKRDALVRLFYIARRMADWMAKRRGGGRDVVTSCVLAPLLACLLVSLPFRQFFFVLAVQCRSILKK